MKQKHKKSFIITGGIATGKSSVLQCLVKTLRKVEPKNLEDDKSVEKVFSADECIGELWEKEEIRTKIQAIFEVPKIPDTTSKFKSLIVKKLIENPCKKEGLEAILHPEVEQAWCQSYRAWMKNENASYFISEIPLLNATNSSSYQGETILVNIPTSLQIQRLRQRLSNKGVRARDKQQELIDFYLNAQKKWKYNQIQADYFIWNIQGESILQKQIDTIINHA